MAFSPRPGRFSRGCSTCRIRRVKCDESQPTCTRCAKSKRVCLGYDASIQLSPRDGFELPRSSLRPRTRRRVALHREAGKASNMRAANLGGFGLYDEGRLLIPMTFIETVSTSDHRQSLAARHALEAIDIGLQSLREPSQTPETRRTRQQQYQRALTQLRESLVSSPSHASWVAPLYFAVYEASGTKTLDIMTEC